MDHGSRRAKTARIVAVVASFLLVAVAFGAETFRISDYFSAQEIERGARFNRYLYSLFVFKQLALVLFLGLVAWSRLARSYQKDVEKVCLGKRLAVFPVYAFLLLLMIRLVQMPFDAVRDLVVREAYGLNNQGVGGWLSDQMKGFVVADIWYVPFVILFFATLRRLPRTWWLVCAGVVGLGFIAWTSLAPYVVHPLFYEIAPVKSEALRSRLDPLLDKAGFSREGLYEARSGEKGNEVNAYLSGLLLGRRIVLYDVLADEVNPTEMEFVVAHELAHWRYRHTTQGIVMSTVGTAAVLLVIGVLLKRSARRKGGTGEGRYEPSALPAFFFWLNLMALLLMPLGCVISRRFETRADRYALELTGNPQVAMKLFQKVAKINIADLDPPPLARFWLYTHPPIPERMEAALRMAKTLGTSGGAQEPEGAGHEADAKPEAVENAPGTDQPQNYGPEEQGEKDGETD